MNIQIGDLVHVPRYPFWGMGVVIEIGTPVDGLLVHWLDSHEKTWIIDGSLEKL